MSLKEIIALAGLALMAGVILVLPTGLVFGVPLILAWRSAAKKRRERKSRYAEKEE